MRIGNKLGSLCGKAQHRADRLHMGKQLCLFRALAHSTVACGSMVLFLYWVSSFALRAKEETHGVENHRQAKVYCYKENVSNRDFWGA